MSINLQGIKCGDNMAYINKKDKVLMLELITEKVQKYLSKNEDGDNDYMILRLIELAENLGLDTNLIIESIFTSSDLVSDSKRSDLRLLRFQYSIIILNIKSEI